MLISTRIWVGIFMLAGAFVTPYGFAQQCELVINVMLVDDDLKLTPVPRHGLTITNGATTFEVQTSFSGEATLSVPGGTYQVRSNQPVLFKGVQFRWDRSVTVDQSKTLLELSNDNALVVGGDGAFNVRARAAELYEKYKDGVVTVEGEASQGTGFLIDSAGLILTNEHVVAGSRFFVARFAPDKRFEAKLVFADPTEDVAVLKVNRSIVANLPVLPLAQDQPNGILVRAGEPVYAIGSPLNQEKIITQGIASKVEEGAVITDVMIDHGNSGGPLLNSNGEVIGINTFGEGRGVSGSVRVWKAYSVLNEARNRTSLLPEPSAKPRPSYPDGIYPSDAIQTKILSKGFDLDDYAVQTSKFTLLFLTPPALAYYENEERIVAAQGRQKRRERKRVEGEDTFQATNLLGNWGEYVGEYKPIVQVQVIPREKATFGSALLAGLSGVTAAIKYRYAGDFDTLTLTRAGEPVAPLSIGRVAQSQVFRGNSGYMEDAAYAGVADFTAESFMPPANPDDDVVIEIVNEVKPENTIREKLPVKLLERIWDDFSLMRLPAERTVVSPPPQRFVEPAQALAPIEPRSEANEKTDSAKGATLAVDLGSRIETAPSSGREPNAYLSISYDSDARNLIRVAVTNTGDEATLNPGQEQMLKIPSGQIELAILDDREAARNTNIVISVPEYSFSKLEIGKGRRNNELNVKLIRDNEIVVKQKLRLD